MGHNDAQCAAEQKPLITRTNEPALAAPAADVEPVGQWSTELCDCCAYPGGGALACVSMFMPCVQYGVLAEQLPQGSTWVQGRFCGSACSFFCLEFLASLAHISIWPGVSLLPTSALLHMEMRRSIRAKYGIKGSWMSDLCTAWWCGPCALMQETREIIIREQEAAAAAAAAVASGSAQAPAMPQQPQLLGYLFMVPPGMPAAPSLRVAPPPAVPPTYIAGGIVVPAAVPATGVPVPCNAVPPTHVATVALPPPPPPAKDTPAPAKAT